MLAARVCGAFSASLMVVAVACHSGTEPVNTPRQLTLAPLSSVFIYDANGKGNGQIGAPGSTLPMKLSVQVFKNQAGVNGVSVTFAVVKGSATLSPAVAPTATVAGPLGPDNGVASTTVTLGTTPGPIVITATVAGLETNLVAVFNVGATLPTVSTPACQGGSPVTPAAGATLTDLTGSGICLSGGSSGATYALVAFYANPDSSQIAPITVQSAGGVTAVTSASISPLINSAPTLHSRRSAVNRLQESFDNRLRVISRRELTSRIPGAREFVRQRAASAASFSLIPSSPKIGSIFTLNANGNSACDSPINVGARVAAVSNLAIVVADTGNPAGGFTDAEYASFAATFDTLISPIDVKNFGAPSDVDLNGKTIIFFTKEVNKLTPRGSGGVVGGFFFERDLFPTSDTQFLQACAASNFAEMYYSLVPDPNGQFSDVRSKQSVLNLTPGTLVHEFQHLINAGRRLYATNADAFEDVWLNEGLSHAAEELLYYHVAGLTPRQNITTAIIGSSPAQVNAFNNYQGDNTGRYEIFLGKPNQTSVYAGNDSLETRGATWNLLRYLVDHTTGPDSVSFQALDNTALTGQQNIAHVFGTNYLTQIRDWATSVFADDLPGQTDVRFSQPSWNYRQIFPRLVDNNGNPLNSYPLTVFPLSDASPVNVSVDAGGAAYIRFAVPANAAASINWSSNGLSANPLMQFTVVRSQ